MENDNKRFVAVLDVPEWQGYGKQITLKADPFEILTVIGYNLTDFDEAGVATSYSLICMTQLGLIQSPKPIMVCEIPIEKEGENLN